MNQRVKMVRYLERFARAIHKNVCCNKLVITIRMLVALCKSALKSSVFFSAQQSNDRLIVEVFKSHTIRHTHTP